MREPGQWHPAPPLEAACGPALRLCAQLALTPEERAALAAAVAPLTTDEWTLLAQLAARHRLAPLAFKHLAEAGLLAAAPTAVAGALKAAYIQSLVANRIAWDELAACLAALDRAGVPAIPVKGVLLARRYYGEPALRPTADIDLLIQPRDLARADPALRSVGYQPRPGWARRLDEAVLRFRELQYEKPGVPPIELHLGLIRLPAYRVGLADQVLWTGAREIEVDGLRAHALDQGDELRYLSLHYVVQHGGERLLWLADVVAIAAALPATWNWEGFVARTAALRMASPVLAALNTAVAELGARVPASALRALEAASATPPERAAWRRAHAQFASLTHARGHLATLGSAREQIAFLWSIAGSAWRRARRHLTSA